MSAPLALAAPAGVAAPASPFDFTAEQRQLIRDTFANGCSDGEFAVLMEVARARRLNPLLKQIHFVQRWDSEKHRMVWAAQVSIDGLRAIAERTKNYQGQDEPEYVENDDGSIKLCKVRVWRRDWPRPSVGVAYWSEYVQTTRDKQTGKTRPTAMWARMPHVMLAKVAESIALRKAFPEDMGGLYSTDEMAQALVEVPEAPAAPERPGVQRVEVTAGPSSTTSLGARDRGAAPCAARPGPCA
ncbi:MAG: phage recombination protein Bet [Polyangiales bacterium]